MNEKTSSSNNNMKGTKILRGIGESSLAFVKGRRQSKEMSAYLNTPVSAQNNKSKAIWYDSEGIQSAGFNGWEVHYAALLHYLKQNGHANIPQKEKYECLLDEVGAIGKSYHYAANLGQWLNTQRKGKMGTHASYRLGGTREQLLQLLVDQGHLLWDASEFKATVKLKRVSDNQWPIHYAALLQFNSEFGHCNVPKDLYYRCQINQQQQQQDVNLQNFDMVNASICRREYPDEYYCYEGRLGQWLQRQRQAKKGTSRSYKLTPDREAKLQSLVDSGLLKWDASDMSGSAERKFIGDSQWPLHYAALLQFGHENGHCNVPYNHRDYEYIVSVPNPTAAMTDNEVKTKTVVYKGRLGEWLNRQRQTKLTPERAELMQELVQNGMLRWSLIRKPRNFVSGSNKEEEESRKIKQGSFKRLGKSNQLS